MGKRWFVILLLLFVECTGDNKINVDRVIPLRPDQAKEVELSDITNDVEFLRLITDNDVYIGDLTSIQITEDRIYALDTFHSQGLYIFDRKGLLLHTIQNYGEGPGEFTGPSAFAIDDSRNHVILYDAGGNKLIFYDKSDLDFLTEKKLSFFPETFTVTDNNFLFYLNNIPNSYESNILITDKNLNIVDHELPINKNLRGYHFYYPFNFSSSEDNLYFFAPSVYEIYITDQDQNSFREYIKVDFGNRALPKSFYAKHPNNQSRMSEIGDSAYNISNYFETESLIFFSYKVGERSFHYYIESKKTDKVIHTKHSYLEESEKAGPLPLWPIAAWNNILIWHQQPMFLERFLNSKMSNVSESEWKRFTERNKKLINFSETITDDDNPYLLFMEINF